jgi:hypothetical protein
MKERGRLDHRPVSRAVIIIGWDRGGVGRAVAPGISVRFSAIENLGSH